MHHVHDIDTRGQGGAARQADALRVTDLAHDLRNLVGLVRALAEELPTRVRPIDVHADEVLRDLLAQSSLAMESLSLLEHWDSTDAVRVSLGAWVWALRLHMRELLLGANVAHAGSLHVAVPALLTAGRAFVRAFGRGAAVRVDAGPEGELRFESRPGSPDPHSLERACEMLVALGLSVERESNCVVRVAVASS